MIRADDPPVPDMYLVFSNEDDCYITVQDICDIGKFDYFSTVEAAEKRAKEVDSQTLFGRRLLMEIVKVNNFKEAFIGCKEPDIEAIKVINFEQRLITNKKEPEKSGSFLLYIILYEVKIR